MIATASGVTTTATYEPKKLDSDCFADEEP
jgi:hypothetical protein